MEDDCLSDSELELTKQFLKFINDIRRQHNAEELSFKTAVKFMMARKFDVRRALALYEAHEMIRFREKLTGFDPLSEPLKKELQTGKFTVLPNRDSKGCAIVMFTVSKHIPSESKHETTLQAMVYQMDAALEDIKTQKSGILFVYNMTSSKYSNFDYELSQKILGFLKGAYPARLKKVLIVMAPLWFKAPFKILRLFVREKLRDRVLMVNIAQLPHHIPMNSLPAELGGLLKHDHSKWIRTCHELTSGSGEMSGGLSDLAFTSRLSSSSGLMASGAIIGGGLSESTQSLNLLQMSDDDDESSASSAGDAVKEALTKTSSCPVPGSSPVNSARRTLSKPKPEKIIMPSQINLPNHENGSSRSDNSMRSLFNGTTNEHILLHQKSDPGVTLEEFIQYMKKKGRKGLFDEYNEVKNQPLDGSFEASRLRDNITKNRYTDVLCFDHSRVKLSVSEKPLTTTSSEDTSGSEGCEDYINANFVDGYEQKKAFISTQGPLPKTFNDFWMMCWQEKVAVIVMTTRTVERCRQKCGQYWPLEEGAEEDYNGIQVNNTKVEPFADYVVTTLTVTFEGEDRTICHMIFNAWPDYGVPHSAVAMLDFRQRVREKQEELTRALGSKWTGHPKGPPIVVHCSAGIGRTGTFMTLDISLERLEDTGKIDVKTTVEKIRSQRAHSIQMPDQYVFCYLAILEYALTRGLLQDVDLTGFDGEDESDLEE